jgi:hypothetical protein
MLAEDIHPTQQHPSPHTRAALLLMSMTGSTLVYFDQPCQVNPGLMAVSVHRAVISVH